MKSVLMVVTNHGDIDGKPTTGVWFSEFSEPFNIFVEKGLNVTVASPKGGPAPVDPRGYPSKEEIVGVRDALERLNATVHLSSVNPSDFDGIFMPGGHGPMFDLASDTTLKQVIAQFWERQKPVGAVCHGPASLLNVALSDGSNLLSGRRATGFSKSEDEVDALFKHMPFSLEDRMRGEGAAYESKPPKSVFTVTDGLLVTGQNPASAEETALAFLKVLEAGGAGS